MTAKNASTHLSALASGIAAVVAYFHPGFAVSPWVQAVFSAVCVGGAVALESLHINFKRDLLNGYNSMVLAERRFAASAPQPVAALSADVQTWLADLVKSEAEKAVAAGQAALTPSVAPSVAVGGSATPVPPNTMATF